MKSVFKVINNSKGVGVLQMLMLAGVVGVAITGMLSMTEHLRLQQKRMNIFTVIKRQSRFIQHTIENDVSWRQTIRHASNAGSMNCLRQDVPGTTCADGNKPAFNLSDAQGVLLVNTTNPVAGFTYDGGPCNAFNAVGNDACPFRWTMGWSTVCPPGTAPCKDPRVTVTATLTYRAATTNFPLNTTRFDINMDRTGAVRHEAFRITYTEGAGDYSGGGTCSNAGAYATTRPLNNTNLSDPFGNVLQVNPANERFQLRPGTYVCDITTHHYSVGGFRVRLERLTNPVNYPAGQGYASPFNSAMAIKQINFRIDQPSWFRLQQHCELNQVNDGLGRPVNDGAVGPVGQVYTVIACVRKS